MENLEELNTINELDNAIEESHQRPVLLFKHSIYCGISERAFEQFNSYLTNADPRVSYKLIIVQTDREVSDEIATRFQIEHESPQAILIRNGREVWSESHRAITVSSLNDAIKNVG